MAQKVGGEEIDPKTLGTKKIPTKILPRKNSVERKLAQEVGLEKIWSKESRPKKF